MIAEKWHCVHIYCWCCNFVNQAVCRSVYLHKPCQAHRYLHQKAGVTTAVPLCQQFGVDTESWGVSRILEEGLSAWEYGDGSPVISEKWFLRLQAVTYTVKLCNVSEAMQDRDAIATDQCNKSCWTAPFQMTVGALTSVSYCTLIMSTPPWVSNVRPPARPSVRLQKLSSIAMTFGV